MQGRHHGNVGKSGVPESNLEAGAERGNFKITQSGP